MARGSPPFTRTPVSYTHLKVRVLSDVEPRTKDVAREMYEIIEQPAVLAVDVYKRQDLGYSALVVSQFTLYGDTKKGYRPSFIKAAKPPLSVDALSLIHICQRREHPAGHCRHPAHPEPGL